MRDNQRQKVYDAGRTLQDVSKHFEWDQTQRYVARIARREKLGEIRVKDGRGTRTARGGWSSVNLPKWARNEAIILHEMSHVVTGRRCRNNVASHGPEFCRVYLILTRRYMGYDCARLLRMAMKEQRVKVASMRGLFPDHRLDARRLRESAAKRIPMFDIDGTVLRNPDGSLIS